MPCIFSSLLTVFLVLFLSNTVTTAAAAADADEKLSPGYSGNESRDVQIAAEKHTAMNDGDHPSEKLSSNDVVRNNSRLNRLKQNLNFVDILLSHLQSSDFREQRSQATGNDATRRSVDAVDGLVGRVVADSRREDVVGETAAVELGRPSKNILKRTRYHRRRRRQAVHEESDANDKTDRSSEDKLIHDRLGVEENAVDDVDAVDKRAIQQEFGREEKEVVGKRDLDVEDIDWNAAERDSQERDISYDYIFGHGTEANDDDDALEQGRREAGPTEQEKAEDLAMSKELVNVLIKEVYNKLLKSGAAVVPPESSLHSSSFSSSSSVTADVKPFDTKGSGKPGQGPGKGPGKGKGKPHRNRRAIGDIPMTGMSSAVVDAVETALACHILKRLAAEKLIDNALYEHFLGLRVCFDLFRRRRRRDTATGCPGGQGCDRTSLMSHDYSTITTEVTCPGPAYIRSFPTVQLVHNDAVVSNVSLASFRSTGGYAMDGLSPLSVNNNRQSAALQFTFQHPVTIVAFRLIQTKPFQKTCVSSLSMALELAGERDIWTPILDSVTKQPLGYDNEEKQMFKVMQVGGCRIQILVVTSPLVQLPKPFTVTRVRIYPQSWPESHELANKPVLPLPVFISCVAADETSDLSETSSLPVDRYDSWSFILADVFTR